jgi:hypothetical protein
MSEAFVAPSNLARLVAPWPWSSERFDRPADLPGAGSLIRLDYSGLSGRGTIYSGSLSASGGYAAKIDDLVFERNPQLSWKDFPDLLKFYFSGGAKLPNLKALDAHFGLNQIAAWGGASVWPTIAHVAGIPGEDRSVWARAFLGRTQGGKYDGTGVVAVYRTTRYRDGQPVPPDFPQIYSFALCVHTKVDHAGANHMRGWHPGHCTRCGLNLTVDSGD